MQQAFVIQLYPEADLYRAKFAGRVEHVNSGRADGFSSVEEFISFIEQTVKEFEETTRNEMQESSSEL